MKRIPPILAVFILILFFSCSKNQILDEVIDEAPLISNYLHLSHTRTNTNPAIDSIVERLDYTKFDMLWLGGDLAQLTSINDETMMHVDSIFNVGDDNTLWSLGNHDTSDLERVEQYTNRPSYYATHKNKITFIILNTQDSVSSILAEQKEFTFSVLDTIQKSTHLVVLHHKLVWMYNNKVLEPQISDISNGGLCDETYCINPNNFNTEIYPRLIEIKERGIEVLCIAGDIGFKAKEFEHVTPEGIHFLASGIRSNTAGNKALVFNHDRTNDSLSWRFTDLLDL